MSIWQPQLATNSEARLWEALRGCKLGVQFRRQVGSTSFYIWSKPEFSQTPDGYPVLLMTGITNPKGLTELYGGIFTTRRRTDGCYLDYFVSHTVELRGAADERRIWQERLQPRYLLTDIRGFADNFWLVDGNGNVVSYEAQATITGGGICPGDK